MPGENLTRAEAHERAAALSVESYVVTLDLTAGDETFTSTSTIRFRSATPGTPTWVDLLAPRVLEVTLNGESLDPGVVFDGTRVGIANPAEDNELQIVAECAYSSSGEGLHRFVDPVDGEVYLYTQFQVADARRMFACFEQPDLKATFAFTVTAPAGWEVTSNAPTPKPRSARGDTAVWKFEPTARISTYITALVAGPYHVVRGSYEGKHGTIPLGLFCRASLAEHLDADAIIEVTQQGFAFFEDVFGLAYPFGKYDQLFVPEFNGGAMENAGAVTFREEYVFRSRVTDAAYERRAETILHEMAHMWFGDLVTMRWWDDLWLNESFATWASVVAEVEATRWTDTWTTFANSEKLWALHQDQLPTTHPIAAEIRDLEDVAVNFDGITYSKGASVLKQLVAWVGRDQFLAGLRRYFEQHAYGNTELRDLFDCLEDASGRDLDAWGEQWLRTTGVNTLRPEIEVGDDGTYISVVVRQSAAAEHPTLRAHRIAIGLYDSDGDGPLRRRTRVEMDVDGEETEVPELVGKRKADLLLLNDEDLTFAKLRFDPDSLDTVISSIADIEEPLARSLSWTAVTDMLRDAELPTRTYVEIVLESVGREREMSVLQQLLMRARHAIDVYADPASHLALSALWASGLHRLAHEAVPGSDHQLAFVRAWASAAASPEHVVELGKLLSGEQEHLDGLVVDADLRWHLLQSLVALGEARDADIEGELARDNTASGRQQAAQARAMRPALGAKAEAWQVAVEAPETTNAIRSATLAGFAVPDQRELLRPFVDRYFESLTEIWRTRTLDTARQIVVRLYPRLLVEPETISRTDEWLAEADPPPALRRLVIEGRADVERALAAQARDRAEGETGPLVPHVELPTADSLAEPAAGRE